MKSKKETDKKSVCFDAGMQSQGNNSKFFFFVSLLGKKIFN